MSRKKPKTPPESYAHPSADRPNLASEETAPYMTDADRAPRRYSPPVRSRGGPRLAWDRDESLDDFAVDAHPLYIHEKLHPETFARSLTTTPADRRQKRSMFGSAYNDLPAGAAYEWYQHRGRWQNRIIRGDSRRIMASLLEREKMAGKVQLVYFDPPYGIRFKSNFQPSARKREVGESADAIPSDPGIVRTFRDTYQNGIHSYLDAIYRNATLARSLLHDSGSIFLQIGTENVHRLAVVLDEVFGSENRVALIPFVKSGGTSTRTLPEVADYLLWFAKDRKAVKFRKLYEVLDRREKVEYMSSYAMVELSDGSERKLTIEESRDPDGHLPEGARLFVRSRLVSPGHSNTGRSEPYVWRGRSYPCPTGQHWRVSHAGLDRLAQEGRLIAGRGELGWKWYEQEMPGRRIHNVWSAQMSPNDLHYVVETAEKVIERCILMATDPGDLVLDITCGSGTTAFCAEKWGRRWITTDAAGVPIALARQRVLTGIYPYHLLQDSAEGAAKEISLSLSLSLSPKPSSSRFREDPAHGFVYERVPYVSAGTLAYGEQREPTFLVDRPYRKPGVVRVSSPFTVESESPYRHIPVEEVVGERRDSDTVAAVRAALETAGVVVPGDASRLRLEGLEPWVGTDAKLHLVTHLGRAVGEEGRVAVAILPDDITASAALVTRAANEAVQIEGVGTLLVIAFHFEAGARTGSEQRGRLRVLKAQANRDLQIGNLKDGREDQAFVLVGEPDVRVEAAAKPSGHFICEVLGYDVFDPASGNLRPGRPDEIACWMLDTDYDGEAFFAHRVHFPGAGRDKQVKRFADRLGARLDRDAFEAMLSLRSTPFPRPETGQVAVRIMTHTGAEMSVVVDLPKADGE